METNKTELLPFDLEKALAGEPVVTRDGRPVTQLHRFNIDNWPLAGVLGENLYVWRIDGTFNDTENARDLFMAPKPKVKREGWVSVYTPKIDMAYRNGVDWLDGATVVVHIVYETKEEAAQHGIPCKIEWEEEA